MGEGRSPPLRSIVARLLVLVRQGPLSERPMRGSRLSHITLTKLNLINLPTHRPHAQFPHHDNEIAQCEAHSGSHSWVGTFLHSGHLNIDGLKARSFF